MHNPSYRLINPQANRSIVFKWEPFDLTTRWHSHPELELIYFIEGCTTGVIGDTFREFREGDLVLLGANFPHVLQENKSFARQYPEVKPFGLIIQFAEDFLGQEFWERSEMTPVHLLLERASRGIQFGQPVVEKLIERLLLMHQLNNTRKLLDFLNVLVTLAETDDYEFLTHKDYYFNVHQDEERMRKINQFVYEHFHDKITIAEVAAVANMTETAFCRYFRSRTLKQFTRFLNEIRIAYSCKLLQKPDYSVTDAAFESGFNSLSYFNRQFKKIIQITPRVYQKRKSSL